MLKSFVDHSRLTSLVFVLLSSLVLSPEILFALSSDTQPLSSNIFVQIAKKQIPAVVNVSIKGKSEAASKRNFPAPRRGPRRGRRRERRHHRRRPRLAAVARRRRPR